MLSAREVNRRLGQVRRCEEVPGLLSTLRAMASCRPSGHLSKLELHRATVAGALQVGHGAGIWFVRPNVRGKLATTAGRQAQATENVHRTCGLGLVACRWCSA